MNLQTDCELVPLSDTRLIEEFDCGDDDLNDFFNHDAIKYQQQFLCQTYFFRHKETGKIVCSFSLSAESIKTYLLPGSRRKKIKELIPHEKNLKSYPAILIGRLGVSGGFEGQGIGTQLMEFIKWFCLDQHRNLFRFILVDAYNNPAVLKYYQKNDFNFVFSTEQQERENFKNNIDTLYTRQMFYDIGQWKDESIND
jgi:GNAT superfamily N-acetyltransferase